MNIIYRIVLMIQIYSLDITISGQTEALDCVSDPLLQYRIEVARANARRERARLRAEYNATLPVGKRRCWRVA